MRCLLGCQVKKMPLQILQGTLDLMILRTLATMVLNTPMALLRGLSKSQASC